jgi:hypothetical protein
MFIPKERERRSRGGGIGPTHNHSKPQTILSVEHLGCRELPILTGDIEAHAGNGSSRRTKNIMDEPDFGEVGKDLQPPAPGALAALPGETRVERDLARLRERDEVLIERPAPQLEIRPPLAMSSMIDIMSGIAFGRVESPAPYSVP